MRGVPPQNPVVQLTLFAAPPARVPPENAVVQSGSLATCTTAKPGGTGVYHPIKNIEVVQQAAAKAHTPPALTRGGGTPLPGANPAVVHQTVQPKATKPKASAEGRAAGGPACVGCRHYTPKRAADGALTGRGRCLERGREVAAVYRGACAAYVFHATRRKA